jgi:Fe-Mn family superoxide dismutase
MITLPDLPYGYDQLEPAVSGATMRLHHGKHHAAYVAKTNDLAGKAGLAAKSLEQIITEAAAGGETALFNNAAQAWNHAFFWRSMTPDAQKPSGDLEARIAQDLGEEATFRTAFVDTGLAHFGSGWLWLVEQDGRLKLTTTHDAQTFVIRPEVTPLLVCDLWEHAYYLDYQNERKRYLETWFDQVANWSFATGCLGSKAPQAVGAR